MSTLLAITIGVLFATGLYLMLRRSIIRLIIGLALIGHAVNLLVFTSGGLLRARPPLITPDGERLVAPYADPLAQALVLTAIVISFGVIAFTLVLVHRTVQATGDDDVARVTTADR